MSPDFIQRKSKEVLEAKARTHKYGHKEQGDSHQSLHMKKENRTTSKFHPKKMEQKQVRVINKDLQEVNTTTQS
jgi:hypothetical protein